MVGVGEPVEVGAEQFMMHGWQQDWERAREGGHALFAG